MVACVGKAAIQVSKNRKSVADGVFKAEVSVSLRSWLKMATLELKFELHRPEQKSLF